MTPLVPVNVDITTSMVAVVTVLTVLVLGPRHSRPPFAGRR